MPVRSAGGRECVYVIVDDYMRAIYMMSLRLRLEAVETFNAFEAVAERELGMKLCEAIIDNACELSMLAM